MHAAFLAALPFLLLAAPFVPRLRSGFFNYFGALFPAQREFVRKARREGRNFYLIHGVSVGEIKLAKFVMSRILRDDPGAVFALTTTSPDSYAEAAAMKLENRVMPMYFPLDIYFFQSLMLGTVAPAAVFILEVDLWPNFLVACAMRRIPVYLLNGRVSDKTYSVYRKIPGFAGAMLSLVDLFFMQTDGDADRIIGMGASAAAVSSPGNMKFDAVGGAADREKLAALTAAVEAAFGGGHDLVIACGSTHDAEERFILEAVSALAARYSSWRILVIIAPRSVARAETICGIAGSLGMPNAVFAGGPVAGRVAGAGEKCGVEVMVAGAMGYLMSAYAMADAAIVGGTFCERDVGGHNIIEPAVFGIPVFFGKNVRNFRDVAASLMRSRIVSDFSTREELTERLAEICDPAREVVVSVESRKLLDIVSENSRVTERIFESIKEFECQTNVRSL